MNDDQFDATGRRVPENIVDATKESALKGAQGVGRGLWEKGLEGERGHRVHCSIPWFRSEISTGGGKQPERPYVRHHICSDPSFPSLDFTP